MIIGFGLSPVGINGATTPGRPVTAATLGPVGATAATLGSMGATGRRGFGSDPGGICTTTASLRSVGCFPFAVGTADEGLAGGFTASSSEK